MTKSISAFDRLSSVASSSGSRSSGSRSSGSRSSSSLRWLVGVFGGCLALRFSHMFVDMKQAQKLIMNNAVDTDAAAQQALLLDVLQQSTTERETKELKVAEATTSTKTAEGKDEEKATPSETTQVNEELKQTEVEETAKPAVDDNDNVVNTDSDACLQHNSKAWLEGPRIGNIREGMTPEMVKTMILGNPQMLQSASAEQAHTLLGQTMCLKDSRFVRDRTQNNENATAETNDPPQRRQVRLWAARLAFLGMHYHQHRLAAPEAQARYAQSSLCSQEDLSNRYNVGSFDYECKDAKYALFGLAGIGIGANVRGGAAVALMTGLISDRIVLFVNQDKDGNKAKWDLASCERADHQCFFMSMSPCVLTEQDLKNAWVMPKHESRMFLMRNGQLPKEHQEDKVIQSVLLYQPHTKAPKGAKQKLSAYAHEFIDALSKDDPRIGLLRKAADLILEDDPPRTGYNFAAASQKVAHVLGFYAMRPNPQSAKQLADILEEIIPTDVDVEKTVGLPIRASDKCRKESECISFDQHMQVTSDMWRNHLNATNQLGKEDMDPTIIFTTESKPVVKDQLDFVSNPERQAKFPFRFRFVTNSKDVTPNTGLLKKKQAQNVGTTADEAMLSAMSSLQAQMKARVSIGNCCSNFHALLSDYMSEGCGSASDSTFLCLQEHEDPLNRVCCGWHHDCKAAKRKAIAALELKAKAAQDEKDKAQSNSTTSTAAT